MIGCKVTIFDPKFSSVVALDVSQYVPTLSYSFAPTGCAAASIQTNLTWTQIESNVSFGGDWALGRCVVEISPAVDTLQASVTAGASKLYVSATAAYDKTQTLEKMQIAIDDGINPCYRIPVLSVGTDGGGPYVMVGSPTAGGGNPTTIPAYSAGATIYLRRYCGRIASRQAYNSRTQKATLQLVGIGQRLAEINGDFSFNFYDAGKAIYQVIVAKASAFSDLDLADMGSFTIGTPYTGSMSKVMVSDAINNILASLPLDIWTLRVGADRIPNLIRTFVSSTETYNYTASLSQQAVAFVPMNVERQDQDTSQMANNVLVIGDVDPNTQQPITVTVNDSAAQSEYLEIDSYPYTSTNIKDLTTATNVANSLLNQYAFPIETGNFMLYVRNGPLANAAAWSPTGLANGDPIYDFQAITVGGFNESEQTNMVPDSGLLWTGGSSALWSGGRTSTPGVSNGDYYFSIGAAAGGGSTGDVILVYPGQVLTLQGSFNATAVGGVGASASWRVYAVGGGVIAGIAATLGSVTRPSVTFTVPAGVYQVQVGAYVPPTAGATGSFQLYWPMLSRGTGTPAYVRNLGAETLYGLPSSLTYTISGGADRTCTVSFAPVVPNINATMRELAAQAATATMINTRPPARIDAYCVSAAIQQLTYNDGSLLIAMPVYLALFAQTSAIITVAAANVTFTANAINYLWLNPNGTYTVQVNNSNRVTGAIYIGNGITDASGICGFTIRAPIGITLGVTSSINYVRDSNIDFVTYSTPQQYWDQAAYWKATPAMDNGVTWYGLKGGATDPGVGTENVLSIRPSGSGGSRTFGSQVIQVIPGAQMTVSGYINGTYLQTSSPLPFWGVYDAVTNTLLAQANGVIGSKGRVAGHFVVPGTTSSVYVQFTQNAATMSGGNLFASIPQLEYGNVMTAYHPGTSGLPTGNHAHASMSQEILSIISATGVFGTGALTFPATANVLNQLPQPNHDYTVLNRISLGIVGMGPPPYVSASSLYFPGTIQFIRGAIYPGAFQTCTISPGAPAVSLATANNAGIVFVQVTGRSGPAYPFAIDLYATGPVGTGFINTLTSPEFEIVGTYGYDGTNYWFSPEFGLSPTLATLLDVLVSSPADGDVLTYVAAASKWENKQPLYPIVLGDTSGKGASTFSETVDRYPLAGNFVPAKISAVAGAAAASSKFQIVYATGNETATVATLGAGATATNGSAFFTVGSEPSISAGTVNGPLSPANAGGIYPAGGELQLRYSSAGVTGGKVTILGRFY